MQVPQANSPQCEDCEGCVSVCAMIEPSRPYLIAHRPVGVALLAILLFLVIGSAITQWLATYGVLDPDGSLVNFFDLATEHRPPTLYAALLLLIAGGLLWLIGAGERANGGSGRAWQFLALLFVFASFDEALSIHERLNKPMQAFVSGEGVLRFPWIVVYGAAAAVIALCYLPFLFRLPIQFRILFFVSGLLYVGGAMGLEMVEGYIRDHRTSSPTFVQERAAIFWAQEALELAGVSLFVYALLRYLTDQLPSFRVGFATSVAER